jgi:hypothetical protein
MLKGLIKLKEKFQENFSTTDVVTIMSGLITAAAYLYFLRTGMADVANVFPETVQGAVNAVTNEELQPLKNALEM